MKNDPLLGRLNKLGYPLMEVEEAIDVNQTLADVVKSDNVRYLEGFPVLLANAARNKTFEYAKVDKFLKRKEDKAKLKQLFFLSLAFYHLNNMHFRWAKDYMDIFAHEARDKVHAYMAALESGDEFKMAGHYLSPERIANTFRNYATREAAEAKIVNARSEELSLEFALSQVFSPRQKELFKKKLKGELFTKTEREYFSRAVKKKVSALANPQLHRLAQRILGI